MYKLVIQDDEGKTTVVPLLREELTIGRKEGNTIRLTERNVSREHAKVYRQNGSISIEDLDSYNGIRVNGARIQGRVDLKEADRVQIGDYLIEVQSDARVAKAPVDVTQPLGRQDAIRTTTLPIIDILKTEKMPTVPEVAEGTSPGMAAVAVEAPTAAAADTDIMPPKQAELADHGRLVVLSNNFAGDEYNLDQPAMVIGRTEDNDIWLNHRSISRHHAKIVRENGRYAIVDMQSANGVRVNGEEYGKVELRRGDVVDLGHVRLRFVEPGEDFLFGRDAQAVDIHPAGGSHLAWWALLVAVCVAGAISYLVMFPQNETTTAQNPDEGSVEVVPEIRPSADKPDSAVAVIDPPPTNPPVNPPAADAGVVPTPGERTAKLLAEARVALLDQNWAGAEAAARQASDLEGKGGEGERIVQEAQRELQMQAVFNRLQTCKDEPCIADQFRKLSTGSVYMARARPLHDEARSRYVGWASEQASARLKVAKTAADCTRDLDRLAKQVKTSWTEAEGAVLQVRKQCSAIKEKEPEVVRPPVNPPPEVSPETVEKMVAQAQSAAKAGQYGKALRLCRDILKDNKGHQEAVVVCAVAACRLKQEDGARAYIRQIRSPDYKGMARQVCLRGGVTLED